MNKKRAAWILFSGATWLVVGLFLCFQGVALLPMSWDGNTILLTSAAVLVGVFKGRFVLSRTAHRVIKGILSTEPPLTFFRIYSLGYLVLIACMAMLGMSLKWMPIPITVRAGIDIAVGGALMQGALFYFRALREYKAT